MCVEAGGGGGGWRVANHNNSSSSILFLFDGYLSIQGVGTPHIIFISYMGMFCCQGNDLHAVDLFEVERSLETLHYCRR